MFTIQGKVIDQAARTTASKKKPYIQYVILSEDGKYNKQFVKDYGAQVNGATKTGESISWQVYVFPFVMKGGQTGLDIIRIPKK